MRLAVCAGGTGGHIYPAVAIIRALQQRRPGTEVLWLGAAGGAEEAVARDHGWSFAPVTVAPVRGTGARAPIGVAVSVLSGVAATLPLRRFRPQAALSTGGYVSVPGVVGSRLARLPLLLFLPDVQPGLAVRFTRRLATRLATTTDAARGGLGGERVAVTGYPVRPGFFTATRQGSRAALGLDDRPALLVCGASQGASSINRAVLRWAPELLPDVQVVHVSGKRGHEAIAADAAAAGLGREGGYHLYPYLEDLPEAMLACDLVVTRAGASVIGEMPAAAKPSVLVPYPYAGAHQRANAAYLVDQGAAVMIEDAQVQERLGPLVRSLFGDAAGLAEMGKRAGALARPDAAAALAELLCGMAGVA